MKRFFWLRFLFFHAAICPLVSQDTIYYNEYHKALGKKRGAKYVEIKVCDSIDLSRCTITGYWLTNNQLMYVERYSDFDNGILDGRRTFWYNDGKVKADLFYKNDKKQGAEKLFYSTGQLRQKIIWNNDSIVSGTFFNEDGTPKEHVFKEDIIDYIYPAIPGYPGKGYNVSRFIYYNIQYPDEAKENNLQGTVVVGFALEPDGSVSNPHIIKSAGKILDDEVLRVMSTIPKSWPKKVNGIPVREEYTYSIPFLLID